MDLSLTLNILISILAGVVAGIHSGAVVARMAKFEELRNQIKRIILNIDYDYSPAPRVVSRKDTSELLYLSSDFYALKHKSAGEQTAMLLKHIDSVLDKHPETFEEMDKVYLEWQKTCRELKPNLRVIFSLRPWV